MNKRMLYRSVLLTAVIILMYASAVGVAHAANLCVHPQGAGQCYTTIQAAVDAASDGDEIVIRPGRYVEQVTIIDKDLTLVGREGAVIQAFPGMEETLFAAGSFGRPIIGVANANVNIRGLTVDGANLAADNFLLVGIMYHDADGVIRDNLIRNIGFGVPTLPLDPQGFPLYQGDAIVVQNFFSTPRTVTVAKNRIVNFNNNGITGFSIADLDNPESTNLTMDIVDNTIVGLGPNDVVDQFGIFFLSDLYSDPSFYPALRITNNHVRDIATVAPHPLPGSGIVTVNTNNLDLSHNEIHNVNVGIETAFSYNAQVARNQLTGMGMEDSGSVGIRVSGSDIQINHNRIRRFETGILLHVVHPFFGPASAFNTSLKNNQFDNVGVEVMTGPELSGPAIAAAPQGTSKWQGYRLRSQP